MARATRSPRSSSAGPGRTQRSSRTTARDAIRTTRHSGAEPPKQPPPTPVWQRGLRLTRRALVMLIVVAALGISFLGSLRIYLSQQHELAVAEQEISERSARIADLESELARWDDPDYVKAQARNRLGWVMPGEVGYRVVDAAGNPLGGGVVIESEQRLPEGEHEPVWWDRLWGSVQTADAPKRRVTGP